MMNDLNNKNRTRELLDNTYKKYKKEMTPLAVISRTHFNKIVKMKEKGAKKRTKLFEQEIQNQKKRFWKLSAGGQDKNPARAQKV